jgi:hypothetical protein
MNPPIPSVQDAPRPREGCFPLDQEYRLASKIEPFSAADIAARDQIIDPDHIRTGFGELLAVMIVCAIGNLGLLCPDHPANRKRTFLATVWTCQRDLLGFFFFVVESFLVHSAYLGILLC